MKVVNTRGVRCGPQEAAEPGWPRPSASSRARHEAPVQAWRAWTDCGDGEQVHLILDRRAQQLWLLPADEPHIDPRSLG